MTGTYICACLRTPIGRFGGSLELFETGGGCGLATMRIDVGQGIAVAVERAG